MIQYLTERGWGVGREVGGGGSGRVGGGGVGGGVGGGGGGGGGGGRGGRGRRGGEESREGSAVIAWWIEKRNLGSAFATAGAGTAGAGSTGAVCYCCHLQHRYDVVKPAKRIIPC
ncbi:hypothetical protein HZH68_003859 [Vespula germanica]|uniref:Uncharacterized protein n=1 Tax=Vespula germanica TaxID=30212 RepID=A0A834KML2_VESGE|nr:hypothetical protein HZH68_003859 [Vespula germanica]